METFEKNGQRGQSQESSSAPALARTCEKLRGRTLSEKEIGELLRETFVYQTLVRNLIGSIGVLRERGSFLPLEDGTNLTYLEPANEEEYGIVAEKRPQTHRWKIEIKNKTTGQSCEVVIEGEKEERMFPARVVLPPTGMHLDLFSADPEEAEVAARIFEKVTAILNGKKCDEAVTWERRTGTVDLPPNDTLNSLRDIIADI